MADMTGIMKTALFTPTSRGWGAPVLWQAEPGCAKTSIVRQQAQRFGLPYEILSPGERGEAAFGVVPVPLTIDGVTYLVSAPPGWVRKFNAKVPLMPKDKDAPKPPTYGSIEWYLSGPCGVVGIDEVTSTPASLQPALLGLALEMCIGEHRFAPRIRPFAMCNPADQAAFGTPLSLANGNRFIHVPYELPTVLQHNAHMSTIDVFGSTLFEQPELDAAKLERHVVEQWRDASNWPHVCGLIGGYLSANEGQKNQCPKVGDPAASLAWGSDRTWEYARRIWCSAGIHKLDQESTEIMVEGCVGKEAAHELFTYAEKLDLPNSADLLDGKIQWEHEQLRIDRTCAVLASCIALVRPAAAEKRKARGAAFWSLMNKLIDNNIDKDLLVPPCLALLNSKPPLVSNAAISVLDKLEDMLAAAGIDVNSFKA